MTVVTGLRDDDMETTWLSPGPGAMASDTPLGTDADETDADSADTADVVDGDSTDTTDGDTAGA